MRMGGQVLFRSSSHPWKNRRLLASSGVWQKLPRRIKSSPRKFARFGPRRIPSFHFGHVPPRMGLARAERRRGSFGW